MFIKNTRLEIKTSIIVLYVLGYGIVFLVLLYVLIKIWSIAGVPNIFQLEHLKYIF